MSRSSFRMEMRRGEPKKSTKFLNGQSRVMDIKKPKIG